jgi:hypothetical protein
VLWLLRSPLLRMRELPQAADAPADPAGEPARETAA